MKKLSFCFVIMAGLLWGTSGLFVQVLAPYGFTTLQISAVRGGVSFLAVALFALIFDRSIFRITPRELLLCVSIGVSLFATGNCYFYSLQITSISTAVVLMYTAPALVMLFSVLFLGERLTPLKAVSLGLMLGGCVFVSGVIGDFKVNTLGLLLGLLSGVAFAAYNILTKIGIEKGSRPISITLYAFLFASFLSFVLSKPMGIFQSAAKAPSQTVPLLIGLGLVSFVVPYVLYAMAMKHLPAGTVSALGIVEPMAATLYGAIFLKEPKTVFDFLGIFLVLLAVLLFGFAERPTLQHKK